MTTPKDDDDVRPPAARPEPVPLSPVEPEVGQPSHDIREYVPSPRPITKFD